MIELQTLLSRKEIRAERDPYLVYALVTLLPLVKRQALPVNLNFLIDAAVLSSDSGTSSYDLNFCAILNELVAGLDSESSFSVTVVKEVPRVYLSSGTVVENGHRIGTTLASALAVLRSGDRGVRLNPDIVLKGLKMSFEEGTKTATSNRLNRIVFLSRRGIPFASDVEADHIVQFTRWLREQSDNSAAPFSIDTYGFGDAINENLLIDIADFSCGRYQYLSDGRMFGHGLMLDTRSLMRSDLLNVKLNLTLYKDVHLRRATSVGPGISLVREGGEMKEGTQGPHRLSLCLGDVNSREVSAVLLELMAPKRPGGKVRLGLAVGDAYVPFQGGVNDSSDIVVNYTDSPDEGVIPLPVSRAISHCSSLRAFQQAESLLFCGDKRGRDLLENCCGMLQKGGSGAQGVRLRSLLESLDRHADSEDGSIARGYRDEFYSIRAELMNLGLKPVKRNGE